MRRCRPPINRKKVCLGGGGGGREREQRENISLSVLCRKSTYVWIILKKSFNWDSSGV